MNLEYERKVIAESIFYSSDFIQGREVKRWWDNQFKKASKMSDKDLIEWAESMIDMEVVNDFKDKVYYLKDEVKAQFERIAKEGRKMLNDLIEELKTCLSQNDEKGKEKVFKKLEKVGMDRATAMSIIKEGAK